MLAFTDVCGGEVSPKNKALPQRNRQDAPSILRWVFSNHDQRLPGNTSAQQSRFRPLNRLVVIRALVSPCRPGRRYSRLNLETVALFKRQSNPLD